MITQDRPTNQPIPTEEHQQKHLHLNPSAPVFRQAGQDKLQNQPLESDIHESTTEETVLEGHLSNGDVHLIANGQSSSFISMPGILANREKSPQSGGSVGTTDISGVQGQLMTATQIGDQSTTMVTVSSLHQQGAYQILQDSANVFRQTQPDGGVNSDQAQEHVNSMNGATACDLPSSTETSPNSADVDTGPDQSVADSEEDEELKNDIEGDFSEQDLLQIRRQIEYYFSSENLPNDKYLNQNMDKDKYVSLTIIHGFNRMRQICKDGKEGKAQMIQAIKTSSVLELNEKKNRVRVSQTRKTLTLRGLPPRATIEDVKSVLKDNDCPFAIHIENIMVQNNVSNWYVSFESEVHCLDAFFKLHGSKAQLHGYTIGCCIKSSGTHAASGYFPSQEDNQQRKMSQSSQPTTPTAVTPPSITPQPQSPAALIQQPQFNAMQMHQFMTTGQSLYYPQGAHPQSMYMNPYVPQMITQGWPGAQGLDPGLIMQNNGLQPQHIRTPMPRPHVVQSGSAQHRFVNKNQRSNRQGPLERSGSERSNDRTPGVGSGTSARSSPRTADTSGSNLVAPGGYVSRRQLHEEAVMPQPQVTQHQYITPLVTQPQSQPQQQHLSSNSAGVTPTTAMVNPTVIDPIAAVTGQHFQQHQQQLMVQAGMGTNSVGGSVPHTQTNNPPPMGHHHQSHHPQTNHHQPPPPLPHHHQQHNHHHHHPPPPHHHQQQPSQTVTHHQPHPQAHHQPPLPHHQHVSVNQHHTQVPPQQHPHHPHQHGGHSGGHHAHHQHMMPPHHHHMPPPAPGPQQQQHQHHHQQNASQGARNDRRPRRKREENPRNSRQSNRANFSSQVPPVADNFTMEANSFPPLPGATNNITSAESMFENKMADVVRGGRPRLPGGPSGNSSVASSVKANSTTPSPVATPAPSSVPIVPVGLHSTASVNTCVNSTSSHQHSAASLVDSHSIEAALEDLTCSSQDEDGDVGSQVSQDVQGILDAVPLPQRVPKVQAPVASAVAPSQKQMEVPVRTNVGQVAPSPTRSQIQQPPAQQMISVICPVDSTGFKMSYAQIAAAQKNREAAANNGLNTIEASTISTVSPVNVQTVPSGNVGSSQTAPSTANTIYKSTSSGNGSRDQVASQPHGARLPPRSVKDNSPRVEGPISSRPVNGRRNSKETRTVSGKFDRRKGDGRAK